MPRKKRLFALLLSLCMVVAMVPVAVLAAGAGMPQNIRWAESPKSMVQWDAPSGGGQYQYELQLKLGETIIDGPDLTVQRYHLFNGSLMTEARENYTVEIRARSCIIVGEFPNEYVTSPGEWGDWATLEGSGGGGEGSTPRMNTASAAGRMMAPITGRSAAAERDLKRAPITSANGS